MASRLTRNQILQHSLDMADSAVLDNHDRPGQGPIIQQAYSLRWLQDALDYFSHIFPWAYDLKEVELTVSSASVALPVDFIIDMKDGVAIDGKRVWRRSAQELFDLKIQGKSGKPCIYNIQPPNIKFAPTPDTTYIATLAYYALPDIIGSCEYPLFPSDWILIEYVRLRALEFLRVLPPGSAMTYAKQMVVELQKSGFANEPEYTSVPLDPYNFSPGGSYDRNGWMGAR